MNTTGNYRGIPATHHLSALVLRLALGGFMLTHGIPKIINYSSLSAKFMDFMSLGSELSLILTIASEVGCSLLLILGVFTRAATIPLIITMGVAAFGAHADDPFSAKEMALLYSSGYLALLLTGGGRYSMDWLLLKNVFGSKQA